MLTRCAQQGQQSAKANKKSRKGGVMSVTSVPPYCVISRLKWKVDHKRCVMCASHLCRCVRHTSVGPRLFRRAMSQVCVVCSCHSTVSPRRLSVGSGWTAHCVHPAPTARTHRWPALTCPCAASWDTRGDAVLSVQVRTGVGLCHSGLSSVSTSPRSLSSLSYLLIILYCSKQTCI